MSPRNAIIVQLILVTVVLGSSSLIVAGTLEDCLEGDTGSFLTGDFGVGEVGSVLATLALGEPRRLDDDVGDVGVLKAMWVFETSGCEAADAWCRGWRGTRPA